MYWKMISGMFALGSGILTAWGTRQFSWFEETLIGLGITLLFLVVGLFLPMRRPERQARVQDWMELSESESVSPPPAPQPPSTEEFVWDCSRGKEAVSSGPSLF